MAAVASPHGLPVESGSATRSERLRLAVGTALLALASFWAAIAFGRELVALGVLGEWNVLFDADPNIYFRNFATGRTFGYWGGRSFIHPNLTNFVHLPLRTLSELLAWLPFDLGSAAELRERLALLVTPVVAAVRVPLLALLMRALGLSVGWTLALCAMDTVSFSTRLFASIPESYLITGTLVVLILWMGVRALSGHHLRPAAWLVALFLLGGVATLSLSVGAVILFVALRAHHRGARALLLTAALVVGAFTLNALAYQISRAVYSAPPFHPRATEHLDDGWNPGAARIAYDYPRGLANAYLPPSPGTREEYHTENHHTHVLTFERGNPGVAAADARTVIFLGILVLCIAAGRRLPPGRRAPHGIAVTILALGALLHGVFGRELVLYAQHWKIAVLVLVAGLYHLPAPGRTMAWRGLVALVLAMTVNNALVMRDILRALAVP